LVVPLAKKVTVTAALLRLQVSAGILMIHKLAARLGALDARTGRWPNRECRRAQNAGCFRRPEASMWLISSAEPVDLLGLTASRPCLSRLDTISRAEDQLFAKLVYGGGARQHDRAGDPEVMQDALERTGKILLRIVGFGAARFAASTMAFRPEIAGWSAYRALQDGCTRGASWRSARRLRQVKDPLVRPNELLLADYVRQGSVTGPAVPGPAAAALTPGTGGRGHS
jgi:hypothetical protein